MTDAVSFADVLFLLVVCTITGGILTLVNRKRSEVNKDEGGAEESNQTTEDSSHNIPAEDEK